MRTKKKITIIEQYLSWNGHYRQYFENLISKEFNYIYCSKKKASYPNSIFLPASYDKKNTGFISFIKGRFVDSYKAYKKVIGIKSDVVHLIEFEPFSFLYLFIINRNKIPLLIITVHSIERMKYANKIKDMVSALQRKTYQFTLRKASAMGATFVTHYKHHEDQLALLPGTKRANSIRVINYPCPEQFPARRNSEFKQKALLIYGQIREDKGIFEFLSKNETKELSITIAGKIQDERILDFKHPNLTIINKFISDEELPELIGSHAFMLLPYKKNYTGGAGTLKDSISYGLPIIASDIPIFQEVVKTEGVGFIFNDVTDIQFFLDQVSDNEYKTLQINCSTYAQKFNWNYMRQEYFKLYQSISTQI